MSVHYKLKDKGFLSWYDNNQNNLSPQGMEQGVRESGCFLLILTKGVLTRKWVLQEFKWAVQYQKPIQMLYEGDSRMASARHTRSHQ